MPKSPFTFDAATLIIYTGSLSAKNRITAAFTNAGWPSNAINFQNWPQSIVSFGQDPTKNSFIHFQVRLSEYGASDAAAIAAFAQQNAALFPYIRLTPFAAPQWWFLPQPVNEGQIWTPDYIAALQANTIKGSEWSYEPYLMGVVQALVAQVTAHAPATLPTGTPLKWQVFPIRPVRVEDDASKWAFENQFGFEGTRDTGTYRFNPVLSPSFDATGLNVTIIVGVHHEQQWPTNTGAPPTTVAHAQFWSTSWFTGDTAGSFLTGTNMNSAGNQGVSSINWGAAAPLDPLGKIYIYAVGQQLSTPAGPWGLCHNLAATIGLNCQPAGNALNHASPMILHQVYTNPNTGVYPSPLTVLPPAAIQIFGAPNTS